MEQISLHTIIGFAPSIFAAHILVFYVFWLRQDPNSVETYWLPRIGGYIRGASLITTIIGISRIAIQMGGDMKQLQAVLSETFAPTAAGFFFALAFDFISDVAERSTQQTDRAPLHF